MRWLFVVAFLVACVARAHAHEAGPASQQAGSDSAAESDLPRFDILEYQVEGNTVLPTIEVERAVYPFLGPQRTIKDAEAARAALEHAYQQAGYLTVLVDIPEQKVDDGVVRLRVMEGKIDRLAVSGNRYYSRGTIRDKVPALEAGKVPHFPDVQKELAQLNRGSDRRVTPVLRPGETPGTVTAELKVEDKLPLHGGIELNNRESPNTEPLRLQAFLRYDNLWQREHSAAIQYLVAPQDPTQVRALSGTYVIPISGTDNVIAFYGVHSRSNVAAIGDLTVIGNGDIVGARYVVPLQPVAELYHSLTLGIDYKQFGQSVGFPGTPAVDTPISYVPLSMQYSGTIAGKRGVTQGTFSANFGPRGVFENKDAEFENNRFEAHANYIYLRGELSREQALPHGSSLFARLGGQVASGPLISNEQFVAGGVDTVRGYLEAEQSGDDAYYGRVELRSPSLTNAESLVSELVVLGFVDGASLHLQDALPGQKSSYNLSSGGVGLRLKTRPHLDATLDVAVPFESAQVTRAGEARVLFKVAYEF